MKKIRLKKIMDKRIVYENRLTKEALVIKKNILLCWKDVNYYGRHKDHIYLFEDFVLLVDKAQDNDWINIHLISKLDKPILNIKNQIKNVIIDKRRKINKLDSIKTMPLPEGKIRILNELDQETCCYNYKSKCILTLNCKNIELKDVYILTTHIICIYNYMVIVLVNVYPTLFDLLRINIYDIYIEWKFNFLLTLNMREARFSYIFFKEHEFL